MTNFLKHHVFKQLFVFFTGLAALLHSTWSIGTLFSGVQPEPTIDLLNRFPEAVQFLGWIVPAFLIALSLDIGQVKTAAEIKDGQRHKSKLVTFAVFAVATYYLQWFYLTEHTPTLAASNGIREEWRWTVQLLRDLSLWIIPLLLPLSTIMYTFSDRETVQVQEVQSTPVQAAVMEVIDDKPSLPEGDNALGVILFEAKCDTCGKVIGDQYKTQQSADRALKNHKARFCEGLPIAEQYPDMVQFINEMHETTSKKSRSNGNAKLITE